MLALRKAQIKKALAGKPKKVKQPKTDKPKEAPKKKAAVQAKPQAKQAKK